MPIISRFGSTLPASLAQHQGRVRQAALLLVLVTGVVLPAQADLTTLYNPGLTAGPLPADQGWISSVQAPAEQEIVGGLLSLDTTADRTSQAGYATEVPLDGVLDGSLEHPAMPILDRTIGFRLQFQLQVLEEGHDTRDDNGDGKDDRAGFSVITISEDLFGVELAFFENRVWAYAAAGEGENSSFTQAEGADFDTTAALVDYELFVQDASYQLFADGTSILNGSLRQYDFTGQLDPYDNPSLLFFGDNTTSADSHVLLGTIGVQSVPEPATWGLLAVLTGFIAWRRFRGLVAAA